MSTHFHQEYDLDAGLAELAVEFSLPEAGWVWCKIRPLHVKYAISCTYLCDPFEAFIEWLEAIVTGASAATWLVEQEGSCSRIQFYGASGGLDDRADFLLHMISDKAIDSIRGATVTRRQVVQSFYSAFRTMAQSADYNPREWDRHPEWTRLEEMEDNAYSKAVEARPYGGFPLQTLRSSLVESYLSEPVQAA